MSTLKLKSIESRFTKAGLIITRDEYGRYSASKPGSHSVIEYSANGANSDYACFFRVRRKADLDDSRSDYFAGSFAHTIKAALEMADRYHGYALEAIARKAAPPTRPEPVFADNIIHHAFA